MGQNLAIIWSTAPLEPEDGDFPSRIQKWFDEVQKYSFGDAWSPKTGHYSQVCIYTKKEIITVNINFFNIYSFRFLVGLG